MSLLFVAFITNAALASSSAFVGDLEAHFFAKHNMDPMHAQTSPSESQDGKVSLKKPLDEALDSAFGRAHFGEVNTEPIFPQAPSQQGSSLNVRKIEKPLDAALDTAFGRAHIGEVSAETVTPSAPSPTMPSAPSQQGSGLNVRKIEDAAFKKPLDEALNNAFGRAHIGEVSEEPVTPSAPSQQGSGLNVRKIEKPLDAALDTAFGRSHIGEGSAVSGGSQRTRFTLKPSNEARASFSKHVFFTPEFSTPKQSKIKVDAQMPSDGSKRGRFTLKPSNEARASFSKHLFSTPEYSAPKQQVGNLAQRRAEYLAQRQEEVENIFHVSKSDNLDKSGVELPTEIQAPTVGVLQGLVRLVILLAAVVSLASIAYSKFEVISQLHEGSLGIQKFKVKRQDSLPGLPANRKASSKFHGLQVTTGVLTSALGSARQGLTRRGAVDTTTSCEFGV